MSVLLKPIDIGSCHVELPVMLAPMAGVSDLAFRILCHRQGAGLVCTEMVSAKAIYYKNKEYNNKYSPKDIAKTVICFILFLVHLCY